MTAVDTELRTEIERIGQAAAVADVSWWQTAELIEQAHEQFELQLPEGGELLSVYQLTRLRRLDLAARWLQAQTSERLTEIQAQFMNTATREQLVAGILAAQ